ncbi:MAG: hypothetical protein HGN29_08910 [Asgard group archaeon]|nr:hypothetical protein [Asgard group archaeon]
MDRRNILSGVLICLILVNFTLATTITIRNIDIIIQEIDNFNEKEGTLNIFFSSNFSQQINSETGNLKLSLLPIINQSYTILEVWLTITEIGLVGRSTDNFTIFGISHQFDLYEGVNTSKFLQSADIAEGFYSAVFLYLDEQIQVKTTEGTINLILPENNFVVIPFNFLDNDSQVVDLDIIQNQTAQILLRFDVIIVWITNTVIITLNSFII